MDRIRVFGGNAHPKLTKEICGYLKIPVGQIEVGRFPDGEIEVRVGEDVRGRHCFVVQPTCDPVSENLMELLIMIDAFRRASAEKITAVLPYYGYARQDRKHAGRVPITAKLVANLLSTAGVDRIVAMDLHATQIQGFFDIPVDHLFAAPVLMEYLAGKNLEDMVIMSPDPGRVGMTIAYAEKLGGELAFIGKRRVSGSDVESGYIIGDVRGKNVVIVDDMISTGGSLCRAIETIRRAGAGRILVVATHGVLCGGSLERIGEAAPEELAITDSIPLAGKEIEGVPLKVLSVAPLLGEAMRRIHLDLSVSSLFA